MLDLLGSLVGSFLGYQGQRETNETNVALNRETREWQERMSNTAYQRAIGDMQKAGLNPMLAYQQGGAGTPNVAPPTIGNALGAGVASGSQVASSIQAIEASRQQKAMTEQVVAQTKKIESETFSNQLNSAVRAAELRQLQVLGDRTAGEAESADVAGRLAHRGLEAEFKHGGIEQGVLKGRAESELSQLAAILQQKTFSADVARRKAESELTRFALPEAGAGARFYEDTGTVNQYLKTLLMLLRGGSSASSILRR